MAKYVPEAFQSIHEDLLAFPLNSLALTMHSRTPRTPNSLPDQQTNRRAAFHDSRKGAHRQILNFLALFC